MNDIVRVLILEDNLADVLLILRELKKLNIEIEHTVEDNEVDMRRALDDAHWDIILSDYSMPNFDAISALCIVEEYGFDIPLIVISGTVGEDVAVAAMKAGAQDFFSKNNMQRLAPAVERELKKLNERKQLLTAELMAQATVDALSAHICILDENGKIISVNQAWINYARARGVPDQENAFLNKNYLEVCDNVRGSDKETAAQVANYIRSVIRNESVFNEMEYVLDTPSSTEWFSIRITRFRQDNPVRIIIAHENITARKNAKQQLARSHDLISLLKDIAIAANEADSIGNILQFTIEHLCSYTSWEIGHGYLANEYLGSKLTLSHVWQLSDEFAFGEFRDLTNTEFDLNDKSLIRKVYETGQSYWIYDISADSEFVRSDIATRCGLQSGYIFPILMDERIIGVFEFFSTKPVDDNVSHVQTIMPHIGTQISRVIERELAQSTLIETEKRYRALFDHSPNPVYIHDLEGNFIDANPALLDLLDYQLEELKNKNISSVLIAEDVDRAFHNIANIFDPSNRTSAREYKVIRRDGGIRVVETMGSIIYSKNKPWAFQGIARDITDRKRAHETEEIRRRFAEALNRTVHDVLDNKTDLDTILQQILHYAGELTPCDTASLMKVEGDTAFIIHSYGFNEDEIDTLLSVPFQIRESHNLREMTLTQQPVFIADTREYDGWQDTIVPIDQRILAYIGMPIFIGDTLFGFINLDASEAGRFTKQHLEQLVMLSDQASIAIHITELYQKIQQYTKRLELLHEIDKAILNSVNPEAIGEEVVPRLLDLIEGHSATITLYDDNYEFYTVLTTTEPIPEFLTKHSRHKFEQPEYLKTLARNQIYIVNDLQSIEHPTKIDIHLSKAGIQSYARIPLLSNGKLLGAINFRSTKLNAFTVEKLDMAREVSTQIAIALENTRLLQIETRRNTELTALHQASLKLTSKLDVTQILDAVLDYTVLLLNMAGAHIYLFDGEKLTFGAAHWNGGRRTQPISIPRPNGLTNLVAKSGERIVVDDLQYHSLYSDASYKGAIIGIPLKMGENVLGVMTLRFNEARYFQEQELSLVELLGDQAAIAIHNAQLYAEIKDHVEKLEERVQLRTRELKRSKDRVEAILDNSSDAIILCNSEGMIVQTNSGFEAQFGYEHDTVLMQHISHIIASPHIESLDRILQDIIVNRETQRTEIVVRCKDNTTYAADAIIAFFEDGLDIGIVCSLRDISIQKQIETELLVALEKERELNTLKTNFTSIVSHEFRTPLAVIMSSTDMLRVYYDRISPEGRQGRLNVIIKQVERMTKLINDVLMITRSDTVGFECDPKELDISALSKELLEEAQIRHTDKGVNIEMDSHGVPESVYIDEFLFSHILQNLASNAIKYSHPGETVYIRLTTHEYQLVLEVEDKGIGMPESYKARLFEAFQRASNVRDIQGTGVGLTIVKRAVDAHGGSIQVDTEEGFGTTFTVKIPLDRGDFK